MTRKTLAKLISFAFRDKLGLFKIAVASSCLMIVPQGQVRAGSITILNPSFEDPIAPQQESTGYYTIGLISNWYSAPSAGQVQGVLDPTKSQNLTGSDIFYGLQPVPDGNQVAYSNGGTLAQQLSAVLQPNTQYTLRGYVGRRNGLAFPANSIKLLAGTTILASSDSVTPAPGTFLPVTVNYTSGSIGDPLIGQPLEIYLSSFGVQTNFDKITLDASPIPEPSAILGLLGFGLLGIVSTLKQKR
ncbi:MAG: PEP-CTERM sorting domain-containing protein [Microcystis novacekii Mn_MB_F_20050700_S1]|uniref:PEP-CTERM sorting domain-containing protein n=1 Tax=Microcystis novacekii Mn_MB_F_20050700_S1D TaxID=2486266 RepID=A0A552IW77_9CHRO|nr:MAG: PEP-CTERM sorting domain-containing protein [Microcystis novacekii Mn_MB_F_20050700_S1]TRU87711.1 MAG: PEP-CTERM sorting domain-containing protein [Microcystis novacekii Mn_MB_F_20050700_S1D]